MSRYEEKIKVKYERKKWIRKRVFVFFLIFLFFVGIFMVDNAYSNMMGYEKEMILGCKRIDSEMIKIYWLGYEVDINSKKTIENIETKVNDLITKTKISFYKVRKKVDELIHDRKFSPKGIQKI